MHAWARRGRPMIAGLAFLMAGCEDTVTTVDPFVITDPLDPNPVVHVTGSGVSPRVSHVAAGVAVRFVNDDSIARRVAPAPHIGFGDCPEVGSLGTLEPGASASMSVARRGVYCAFADQADPASFTFQGVLVVH